MQFTRASDRVFDFFWYCVKTSQVKEAMCSESVLEDIQLETALRCIKQHPGFGPVCLQKWSLRMAGERVNTKAKERYKQTGTAER